MKGKPFEERALFYFMFFILLSEKLSFSFSFEFLVSNKMFQPVRSNHDGELSGMLEKLVNMKGLMLEEGSTNLDYIKKLLLKSNQKNKTVEEDNYVNQVDQLQKKHQDDFGPRKLSSFEGGRSTVIACEGKCFSF